jgi:hypothetical protein
MKKNNTTVKQEISDRDYVGYIEFPTQYCRFPDALKQKIIEKIIDQLFIQIDKMLPQDINRIKYIENIFKSTLIDATNNEEYEYCALIRDCLTNLNEPTIK